MLTIWGAKKRFCDGIARRDFLRIGAFGAGLGGLTLADALRLRAAEPVARQPRPKSVIMIFLEGGPPHIDMYDLKPDAPEEYRGEFRPIATNVPGVRICELFPRQAQMWDKLAVIRSVFSTDQSHTDCEVMTGYADSVNQQAHHPSFGSVLSKVRGPSHEGMPTYATLRSTSHRGQEPGYLGFAHRPFTPNSERLGDLRLSSRGMTVDRLNDRQALLARFDSLRRDLDAGAMEGMDSFQRQAVDMIVSGRVQQALDLSRENIKSRERYQGIEGFLTARRLVEAGAGLVTLSPPSPAPVSSWDTHTHNFIQMRNALPLVDRGVANLVQDLHDRGLDQDVAVIMWGEFGRHPRIDKDKNGGRTHWLDAMSVLIAGGGLKMGQAIGATDDRAGQIKERRYSVQQVLATLYGVVGIDPARQFPDRTGRPMPLLDDREPVAELL